MMYSAKRSMKSRQPGTVEVVFSISGTAGVPAATGQDAMFVSSVVDNGTGDYTITVKDKSLQDLVVKSLVSFTDRAILHVSAVDEQTITVVAKRDDNTAMDADFGICLNFASQVPYYY